MKNIERPAHEDLKHSTPFLSFLFILSLNIFVLVVLRELGIAHSFNFPLSFCLYIKIEVQFEYPINYQSFKKLRILLSDGRVIIIEVQPPTRDRLQTTDAIHLFVCLFLRSRS